MMPTMAFFGSSLVSSYWNGAATYYRGLIRALHAHGWQVTFFEPDAYERQAHRDMPDPPWARVIIYSATDDGVQRALDAASSMDVIVKASGVGVFDEFLDAAVLQMRGPDQIAIYWDVDAPATLERVRANADDPFRALIPKFDYVLTYGGGPPVVSAYRALDARGCTPIYNALDPDTHHPVKPDARYLCDLALLANRLPDRESRIRDFFFTPATQHPKCRFLLAGSGWISADTPSNVACLGHLSTRDHNAFNCSPKAILNVSRDSMARFGYSPATRVFEAAGAGACIITDAWEGVELFLEPDEEILVANNGEEVGEILGGLTLTRARAIGEAARARVLAKHTYAHRVDEVDALLLGLSRRVACPRA